MTKRGRPPKGEYPAKRRVFSSRIREDTWQTLRQAAAESGRSISQEFEHQLRRALNEETETERAFGDSRTLALMKMAAMAALNSAPAGEKASNVHWTSNIEAFDRALKAIVNVLQAFRPLAARDLATPAPGLDAPTLQEKRKSRKQEHDLS